jgi:hypothetical protein
MFGLKIVHNRTCPVHSRLDCQSGTQQFCFQTLVNFLTYSQSCPSHVVDCPGPPSRVALTRRLLLMDCLLHVTTLLTPVMRMTVRCLSGILLLSGPPTWPSAIPRRQSKVPSMKIMKLMCMREASSLVTLAFGHSFTRIGTVLSIFTS